MAKSNQFNELYPYKLGRIVAPNRFWNSLKEVLLDHSVLSLSMALQLHLKILRFYLFVGIPWIITVSH